MQLQLPRGLLDLSTPVVMGILNVTPDSFSDGGRYRARDAALHHAQAMLDEGAAMIDVGGESTRPGAEPVSATEELERVVPVIEALWQRFGCRLSVDTSKPQVMDAACRAGAQLVNDVNALREPGALDAARRHGAAVCLMHMRGEPRTMQQAPHYADVAGEVRTFLAGRVAACLESGIAAERLVLDPGFGFGKNLEHNLQLLAALPTLRSLGRPLLVGLSRKSMFQQLLGLGVAERLPASLAAATLAIWQGASIIRAHDVRATVQAVAVAAAVRQRQRSDQHS